MNKYFIITNDVETTSIVNHCLSDDTGRLVSEEAIPRILDLYQDMEINTTFFITGYFAEKFPNTVKLIYDRGHEIGCHGFSHNHNDGFDLLSLSEQINHLSKAKEVLENIVNTNIVSFRAPALRTNKYTVEALEKVGLKIDSSVASQRFDFFFSLGSKEKIKWLKAPRYPYKTGKESLSQKGDSEILEIPVSAFIIPYIGTTLRIFPRMINILRYFLTKEAIRKGNPINFLIHPIELIVENRNESKIERRSINILNYILKDKLRHKLKMKNLGDPALELLQEQIMYFKQKKFEFITCEEYRRRSE